MSGSAADVVIIGAGIGGLTATLCLLKAGVDANVYERAGELTEVGAGVQISANASRVLRHVGIVDALSAFSGAAISKEIRHWNSGRSWAVPDTGMGAEERYGAPFLMLHRRDLLDTRANAVRSCKPEAIHLNSRCARVEQGGQRVSATFEDGRSVQARCLIGADGIHSAVRNGVFGQEEPRFTGCVAWRGIVPMAKLPASSRPRVSANWIGPGRHVITDRKSVV